MKRKGVVLTNSILLVAGTSLYILRQVNNRTRAMARQFLIFVCVMLTMTTLVVMDDDLVSLTVKGNVNNVYNFTATTLNMFHDCICNDNNVFCSLVSHQSNNLELYDVKTSRLSKETLVPEYMCSVSVQQPLERITITLVNCTRQQKLSQSYGQVYLHNMQNCDLSCVNIVWNSTLNVTITHNKAATLTEGMCNFSVSASHTSEMSSGQIAIYVVVTLFILALFIIIVIMVFVYFRRKHRSGSSLSNSSTRNIKSDYELESDIEDRPSPTREAVEINGYCFAENILSDTHITREANNSIAANQAVYSDPRDLQTANTRKERKTEAGLKQVTDRYSIVDLKSKVKNRKENVQEGGENLCHEMSQPVCHDPINKISSDPVPADIYFQLEN